MPLSLFADVLLQNLIQTEPPRGSYPHYDTISGWRTACLP